MNEKEKGTWVNEISNNTIYHVKYKWNQYSSNNKLPSYCWQEQYTTLLWPFLVSLCKPTPCTCIKQAIQLEGLYMRVHGYWWEWNATDSKKQAFYSKIIKKCNHDERQWWIHFDIVIKMLWFFDTIQLFIKVCRVTCDLAYMVDIMDHKLLSWNKWKINMVRDIQTSNPPIVPMHRLRYLWKGLASYHSIRKKTSEYKIWQHNSQP